MKMFLLMLLLPFILTKIITPKIAELLVSGGAVRKNYLGLQIPTAAGIAVVVSSAVSLILFAAFYDYLKVQVLLVLTALLGICLLGLLDDLVGTRDVTGLKGHLRLLLKGKLSTGGLKALGGVFIALAFSLFISDNILQDIVINTLVIALFTNAVNLMDLRPGRAGKFFLLISTLLLVYSYTREIISLYSWIMLPFISSVLAFISYDLSGKVMLGDTGSNSLGAVLGIMSVLLLPFAMRFFALLLLILLHIYTEKYSLTETIEKVKLLRYIDEWGRTS
ncbi:MAG TPA: hypothetical protein DEA47_03740 [Peptococcaceae bacterium]|nr:MAG: UDP-N-acetylmuramyl pentapeptide phosphotransferase/UDP-N-acetylglucosamine-1-phosphate transferase [Clostridia bacterium 41_269]HBT20463.1 hypothetical protein [Peptococcaceae bacterium]